MIIAMNKWFSIQQVGKDVFANLMIAKVQYDKTKFMYQFTASTDVRYALSILKEAGIEAVLSKGCFICGGGLADDLVDTICLECQTNPEALSLYFAKFNELAASV